MSAPPVIPQRPAAKTQVNEDAPSIPPRPISRSYRSMSPNPARFAQSPLNDNIKAKNTKTLRFDEDEGPERPQSVLDMPSLGEEGMEYSAIPDESPPPEGETHTVGDEVKLAAPKPKLPAQTAKDRVAAVTRTDSDRAASFGIGKPSSERSLKKKTSTASQLSNTDTTDEKDGIPEIGQRIPLLSHAGDVQAPSPAPGSGSVDGGLAVRHHSRRTSARGFVDLPADSYGLHGHGKTPKDKLDKAYYEKHPELLKREKIFRRHEHDRATDFARTSEDLNNIVHATASKRAVTDATDTMPTDEIGYDAHVEYVSRQSRPASTAPPREDDVKEKDEETIHVKPEKYAEGHDDPERTNSYSAPILADDEVARDPRPYELGPAVTPPNQRSGSAFEMEHPKSRPTSRPNSMYIPTVEVQQAPLEDVAEYEPLFPEDDKESNALHKKDPPKQRFPSKDVWEDAPNSVHVTAEVSEPQPPEDSVDSPVQSSDVHKVDPQKLEEVMATAEAENKPRSWVEKQLKMSDGTSEAPQKRFPSRDVWEDTPDSLQLQTTVSGPQEAVEEHSPVEVKRPEVPARPVRKTTGDSAVEEEKPAVSERPKTKPPVPDKPKPVVAGRVGGKIAALQAGFMADLNKRLQTGPQVPKAEEPLAEDLTEEKEKAPLADARKSRARGPQRRAPPTVSKSPGPAAIDKSPLSFSTPRTIWTVEPEEGGLSVSDQSDGAEELEEEPQSLATDMAAEPVEAKAAAVEA